MPTDRPTTTDALTALTALTDRLLDAPGAAGDLVHAVLLDGPHLVTSPALAPTHLDLLVGFRAPAAWHGIAIVAGGATVRVVDRAGDPPEPGGSGPHDAGPTAIAVAVTRRGEVAASSSSPEHRWSGRGTEQVGGFVVDLCRRVLGLDCPVEPRGPVELAVVQWLSLVLDLAADPATAELVECWEDVAALHPAWDGTAPSPEDLASAAVDQGGRWTWEALRRGAALGQLHLEGVTGDVAAWMDAPFLARWLLGGHRAPGELLDDLRLFLDPVLHHALRRVVEATIGVA